MAIAKRVQEANDNFDIMLVVSIVIWEMKKWKIQREKPSGTIILLQRINGCSTCKDDIEVRAIKKIIFYSEAINIIFSLLL